MANIRFLIRRPEDEQPQAIYVSYRFGRNEKLLYALPLKTEAIFWDAERQRVKSSKYCPYTDEVNAAIASISAKMETFMTDSAREGRVVTKDRLKDLLDSHFGKGQADSADFHQFFEAYINECDTRMNGRRGGQNITYKTKREYARTYEYIQQYEKKNRVLLDFADIDQGLLTSFVGFLQSLNLSTNTIWHKVVAVRSVMKAAVERGLTDNERWRYYKNAKEETEAVALTEDELEKIRTCDLSFNPHLAEIRDLFLLGCWTGLRFSDVIRLRPEHIQGDFIVIQQQKTNNYVTIPIHPVFREIWERYDGIPLTISNQKFNDHIKEVCKEAGICDSVLKSITKGGKKITTKYEKWQLVSSHTGRRSFATNLYKSGFPSISIMQITGHKTEAAFLKYIKVTPQEHAKLLMKHWNGTK